MDYFNERYEMDLLKNHIFRDPICDWFEIQNHRYGHYKKDMESKYKQFISKEASNYKQKVISYICDQLGLPIISPKLSVQQTIDCIHNHEVLILNGSLYHKQYNVVVPCDIIIDYESFITIFPALENLPDMNGSDYILINLSYSVLHFRKNKTEVYNDELIFFKKCSLMCFYECFRDLVNVPVHSFLLGKEYYYQKQLLPKKTHIGHVLFTDEMNQTIHDAVNWIRQVTSKFDSMYVLPEPTNNELYPNMNYKESDWETEKKNLATLLREITLIWNISYRERCELLKKDISSWDDPKLLSYLKESKKKNIQERMIHMNQQKEIIVYPRKSISQEFREILEKKNNEYFFDVESFLSFDEKQDLVDGHLITKEPVLGMLGIIQNGIYKDFTIHSFTKTDEIQMIKEWSSHLLKNEGIIYLYHWGNAEKVYLEYIQKECPDLDLSRIKLINVLHYFRQEPILIQGIFSFGLKQIGKVLYNHQLINTTWTEYDNGLDSMIEFKELCCNHTKHIPLKRISEISKIIDYNRIDCQVLLEIVEFLRIRYS